jgi:hypothetical protein
MALDHGDNATYDEYYDNYSDLAEGSKDSAPKMGSQERKLAQGALRGAKDMSAALGLVRDKDGVLRIPKDKKKGVGEDSTDPMDHRGAVTDSFYESQLQRLKNLALGK